MDAESHAAALRLEADLLPLRGLWRGTGADLVRLGVVSVQDLAMRSAETLAHDYVRVIGRPPDPVLTHYFGAMVNFARTGIPEPWWRLMRTEVVQHVENMRAPRDAARP